MCGKIPFNSENSRLAEGVTENNQQEFFWSYVDIEYIINQHAEACFDQDDRGDTLLHLASHNGNLTASLRLIDLAPTVEHLNIKNDNDLTVLHKSVMCNEAQIVKKLLASGADPNLDYGCQGYTALHLAVLTADFETLMALVDPVLVHEKTSSSVQVVPLNLEAKDESGRTALHISIALGYLEYVDYLVQAGANVNTTVGFTPNGDNSIIVAIQHHQREIMLYLAQERPECLTHLTIENYTVYRVAELLNQDFADDLMELDAKKYEDEECDVSFMADCYDDEPW